MLWIISNRDVFALDWLSWLSKRFCLFTHKNTMLFLGQNFLYCRDLLDPIRWRCCGQSCILIDIWPANSKVNSIFRSVCVHSIRKKVVFFCACPCDKWHCITHTRKINVDISRPVYSRIISLDSQYSINCNVSVCFKNKLFFCFVMFCNAY